MKIHVQVLFLSCSNDTTTNIWIWKWIKTPSKYWDFFCCTINYRIRSMIQYLPPAIIWVSNENQCSLDKYIDVIDGLSISRRAFGKYHVMSVDCHLLSWAYKTALRALVRLVALVIIISFAIEEFFPPCSGIESMDRFRLDNTLHVMPSVAL